ncbi:MAG TPA: pteridine reductase [Acidiferrobacter sp.]|nr:pteridine reductase [Acidiferrobacter sp.]
MQVRERVVLLTGGACRLGAVVARHLHERGLSLVLHYRSSVEDAERLKAELETVRPHTVALVQADILAQDAPALLVDRAIQSFGRLDMLVNNASSFYETPIGSASEQDWVDLIGTNLRAPFFLSQQAAPHLASAHGAIVNIVDIHAERPLKGYPIYSIAKAGLVMLTKSLARELAPDVRVNAVAPGAILWPEVGVSDGEKQEVLARIPRGQTGTPEDIAGAVTFLLLDAPYITGHVLAVDGGRSVVL